jgi:hypothetical protein
MRVVKDCIIYSIGPIKQYKGGILGDIDLHEINLLVDSSCQILRESGTTSNVVEKLKKMLEAQDLPVMSVQATGPVLYIQVDTSQNHVHEQLSFRDSGIEKDSLVWRTIYYPTQSDTLQDTIGFAEPAKKDSLGFGHSVYSIVDKLLSLTRP